MKIINAISRVLVGIVFVFSGFVKAIDPLGSTYKFIDYFNAFELSFLESLAFPLAILLSTLEFVIGISLIFSTKKQITAWAVFIFMSFFTVLTLILAIFNPVSDCGCFGDAIIMTNWQTFWKNIFIMFFTLIIFINRNRFLTKWTEIKQWTIISISFILILSLSILSYQHLPLIDFLPYSTGTYIPEKMVIPEGAPIAEYETTLVYTKNGESIEVTIDNIPDSTWQWVESKHTLVKKGYQPPIHDFVIQSMDGEDYTDLILTDSKFTFLLIAHDLKKTSNKNIEKINQLAEFCKQSGNCNFICLTSSLQTDIDEFVQKNNAKYPFFNTDEITLKTMIRANPGIMLLRRGWIIKKWNSNDLPDIDFIRENFINNPKYKQKVDETNKDEFNV
ncbi:MAG: hypothetical protein A2W99_09795 [Bacteroidetes bacterium GWF2_33_16]|nr:MAG: hypothetical protein A2X00_06705 [Bacteroidetes bacterium GWE2_32_14]OFY07285.1 MAG: hypothetical protein A2W99_09795 [Bacteroidetes bacterium GWF2_33_16]